MINKGMLLISLYVSMVFYTVNAKALNHESFVYTTCIYNEILVTRMIDDIGIVKYNSRIKAHKNKRLIDKRTGVTFLSICLTTEKIWIAKSTNEPNTDPRTISGNVKYFKLTINSNHVVFQEINSNFLIVIFNKDIPSDYLLELNKY